VYFARPSIEAIVMWGFWEGDIWKPEAAIGWTQAVGKAEMGKCDKSSEPPNRITEGQF